MSDVEAGAMMRAYLERRAAERKQRLAADLVEARREAQVIVDHIIAAHNPRRIYQWGSLVHPRRFSERSDIDIAVEGLAHPFDLHRILEFAETITNRPLDIVPIEEIALEYADSIRTHGRLVYERP